MNRTDFLNKVSRIWSESQVSDIEIAYLMAKKFHEGQFRKEINSDGSPLRYFEHLRRAALILIDEFGVRDHKLIITALLHDVIEDTEDGRLVSLLVQRLFGEVVYHHVIALSKLHKDSYLSNLSDYAVKTPQILLVKAADRLDNLRSLPPDPSFRQRQQQETRDSYLPLFYSVCSTSNAATIAYSKITQILQEI